MIIFVILVVVLSIGGIGAMLMPVVLEYIDSLPEEDTMLPIDEPVATITEYADSPTTD